MNFRRKPGAEDEVFINEDAAHYINDYILVIDIGNNTINPLYVTPGMKVDKTMSTAHFGVGVKNIVNELKAVLQNEFDIRLDDESAQEDILKKPGNIFRNRRQAFEKKAIDRVWDRIVEPEVRKIIEDASNAFKGKLGSVIFAGGGAELFWDRIIQTFGRSTFNIVRPSNPVLANAHGYFLYSKFKGEQ